MVLRVVDTNETPQNAEGFRVFSFYAAECNSGDASLGPSGHTAPSLGSDWEAAVAVIATTVGIAFLAKPWAKNILWLAWLPATAKPGLLATPACPQGHSRPERTGERG
jgi:hypothetical protein